MIESTKSTETSDYAGPQTRHSREQMHRSTETACPIPVVDERAYSETRQRPDVQARQRSERLDRVVNVVLAGIGLILAAPIICVFTILVRLNSPGPVFYRQARIGIDRRRRTSSAGSGEHRQRDLGGRPFMIFKFRTMRLDAEQHNGAVWATKGDQRVTSLGRIMRKFRVDELPQLVNVIRGEMNIVGPRPERPSIFSRLSVDIPEYSLRQRARPGITGWAQINQAYDTNMDDVRQKVRYDLEYLERQGVTEDLKIMARTVPVMIFRKGGW